MNVLRVRHRDTEIYVSFLLNRFIADWPSAQSKFISGIADGFREWFPMGPRDFSVTPALALEDLRCRCRIFGGQCEIVLDPEALQLDFENVKPDDRPVVQETIRKASEWLTGALEGHGRDLFSFQTIAHLEAFEADAMDAYLGQLMPAGADELTKSEPDVKCLPSRRTVLSGETEGWQLWRVVEKSVALVPDILAAQPRCPRHRAPCARCILETPRARWLAERGVRACACEDEPCGCGVSAFLAAASVSTIAMTRGALAILEAIDAVHGKANANAKADAPGAQPPTATSSAMTRKSAAR